jgi:hypothetical protein
MVSGARVEEPGLILLVGGVPRARVLILKGLVEAVLALERLMTPVLADLAARTLAAIATTATALATSAVAATTAPLVGTVATLAVLLLATGSMAATRRPGGAIAGATSSSVGERAPPSTVVAALPHHGVGGCGELGGLSVLLLERLAGEEHRVEGLHAEIVGARSAKHRERVLKGLILRPETDDDVVDQLLI